MSARRPVKLLLAVLALSFMAGAQGAAAFTGDLKKDPSLTIKAYLDLDLKGARLESISYETLKPYTNWKREISWGVVEVTDSYEVVDDIKAWQVVSILEVWIPVKFQVLGTMEWESATFTPDPHVEEVRFRVKAVGDRWRIMEPVLPPHVSQKRLVNFVRQAMLQETDDGRLQQLAALRDALRNAKP